MGGAETATTPSAAREIAEESADSAENAQDGAKTPPDAQSASESGIEPEIPENAILLVAGEKGEYGKREDMNEESFYAHYLPGGIYSATNAGKYPAQVNVYEGIRRNLETGFDEYTAAGDVIGPEIGESGEITVPEGWLIEIHEPDKATLVRIGDAPEPEPVKETEPPPAPVEERAAGLPYSSVKYNRKIHGKTAGHHCGKDDRQ